LFGSPNQPSVTLEFSANSSPCREFGLSWCLTHISRRSRSSTGWRCAQPTAISPAFRACAGKTRSQP